MDETVVVRLHEVERVENRECAPGKRVREFTIVANGVRAQSAPTPESDLNEERI